jgi:hypothetical protein
MKGLMHRLAARAAGTTVPVRSDARLPIGSANLRWDESFDREAAAEPAGMAAAAEHLVRPHAAIPSSEQPEGSEPAGAMPGPNPHPSPARRMASDPPAAQEDWADQPSASRAASLFPEAQPDPDRAPASWERGISDATQEISGATVPSHRSGVRLPSNDEPALLMPRAADTSAPSPAAGDAAAHLLARTDVDAQATAPPPPLMPKVANRGMPTTEVSAAPRQQAWPPTTAQESENEPTEVHIHIGRIEVTAVHEAAPQRSKPKARQAAMSLESYLAERGKP